LKREVSQVQTRASPGKLEDFYSDHLFARIKVKDDARRNFLGLDNLRVVQPEMEGVCNTVYF
jgi:hypothetical protein